MIKIQYDHQIFSMHRFGGISRYFASIQEALSAEKHFDFNRGILYTNNHYLNNISFPLPRFAGNIFLQRERRRNKWNKRYSRYLIKKNNFDIFHPTYYHSYFLNALKKPFILTVHDMIHERLPEYFPHYDDTMHLKRMVIEKANHFVTVSKATSNDLQEIYHVPEHKISVVHHGFYPGENNILYTPPYDNYILYVGERGGYKNFFRFLTAIASILKKENINLICAGSKPFSKAEYETMLRLKISQSVTWLAPTDGQLNSLYNKAKVFVYPSLYEGFGLPILEAFNNNCPIAASNTSCFKEVGGDAINYFNPYDIGEMAAAISNILYDSKKADTLCKAGQIQLQKFPLKACLEKTIDCYRSLAGK